MVAFNSKYALPPGATTALPPVGAKVQCTGSSFAEDQRGQQKGWQNKPETKTTATLHGINRLPVQMLCRRAQLQFVR